jgi:hypothetical protein
MLNKKYKVSKNPIEPVLAIAVRCIDRRFREEITNYLRDRYGKFGFYDPAHAGGIQYLASDDSEEHHYALVNIHLVLEHYPNAEIVLINHEDCLAYGGSENFKNDTQKEFAFHTEELAKAENLLRATFPNTKIVKVFFTFNGPQEI